METHCGREFFLDKEGKWMRTPSSPSELRDTMCLPSRSAAVSLGSGGGLEEGELFVSSVSREWADWGSRVGWIIPAESPEGVLIEGSRSCTIFPTNQTVSTWPTC